MDEEMTVLQSNTKSQIAAYYSDAMTAFNKINIKFIDMLSNPTSAKVEEAHHLCEIIKLAASMLPDTTEGAELVGPRHLYRGQRL